MKYLFSSTTSPRFAAFGGLVGGTVGLGVLLGAEVALGALVGTDVAVGTLVDCCAAVALVGWASAVLPAGVAVLTTGVLVGDGV